MRDNVFALAVWFEWSFVVRDFTFRSLFIPSQYRSGTYLLFTLTIIKARPGLVQYTYLSQRLEVEEVKRRAWQSHCHFDFVGVQLGRLLFCRRVGGWLWLLQILFPATHHNAKSCYAKSQEHFEWQNAKSAEALAEHYSSDNNKILDWLPVVWQCRHSGTGVVCDRRRLGSLSRTFKDTWAKCRFRIRNSGQSDHTTDTYIGRSTADCLFKRRR